MVENLLCGPSSGDVDMETDSAEIHGQSYFVLVEVWVEMASRSVPNCRIEMLDEVGDPPAFGIVDGDGTVESSI